MFNNHPSMALHKSLQKYAIGMRTQRMTQDNVFLVFFFVPGWDLRTAQIPNRRAETNRKMSKRNHQFWPEDKESIFTFLVLLLVSWVHPLWWGHNPVSSKISKILRASLFLQSEELEKRISVVRRVWGESPLSLPTLW